MNYQLNCFLLQGITVIHMIHWQNRVLLQQYIPKRSFVTRHSWTSPVKRRKHPFWLIFFRVVDCPSSSDAVKGSTKIVRQGIPQCATLITHKHPTKTDVQSLIEFTLSWLYLEEFDTLDIIYKNNDVTVLLIFLSRPFHLLSNLYPSFDSMCTSPNAQLRPLSFCLRIKSTSIPTKSFGPQEEQQKDYRNNGDRNLNIGIPHIPMMSAKEQPAWHCLTLNNFIHHSSVQVWINGHDKQIGRQGLSFCGASLALVAGAVAWTIRRWSGIFGVEFDEECIFVI